MESLSNNTEIYASCPGKILISGGYSILKEENIGISLALDARFYVKSKIIENFNDDGILINYSSPQINSEWVYNLKKFNDNNLELQQLFGESKNNKNPFLESITKTFFCFLKTLNVQLGKKIIQVEIFHDKDFYSENCILEFPKMNPKFPIFDFKNLKKTGIGSSACLVVSVLSSLMISWNLPFSDIKKSENITLIHLLSQIANILAQNKIGSGFDISTAVYGSQIFQKFPENMISSKFLSFFNEMKEFNFIREEFPEIMKKFKEFEKKIQKIPAIDFKAFMMDFSTGSDTRILVSKVKEYLKTENEIVQNFYKISNEMTKFLLDFFENADKIENKEKIHEKNENYRNILKNLGVNSKVEIEPDVLTIILDLVMKNNRKNVVYCICPGAGGYDAACFLVEKMSNFDFDFKKIMSDHDDFKKNVNEIFERKKGYFTDNLENLLSKLEKIEIQIMEKKFDSEGLKLVSL